MLVEGPNELVDSTNMLVEGPNKLLDSTNSLKMIKLSIDRARVGKIVEILIISFSRVSRIGFL